MTNTFLRVTNPYKQKIPKTDKLTISCAKEELKKINELISSYPQPEEIWHKKRVLLAILRKD